MDSRDPQATQWAQLLEKIRDIKFAMLTTEDDDGALHSRPMATLEAEDQGVLWFFTGRSTHKTQEIGHHPRVNLAYASGDKDTFLSVAGTASLLDDPAKARELWSPFMKAWFPQGLDDPDLVLIRVEVESAEFWDVASKKMMTLFRLAKAMAGGGGHGEDSPTHGRLQPPGNFGY